MGGGRCAAEIERLFDPDRIVGNFSSMARLFPVRIMPRGAGPVSPLPAGPALPLPQGVERWTGAQAVTSLLVLKDGKVLHESYRLGSRAADLRMSWSVAKSFLSTLAGILIHAGALDGLDNRAARYAPVLDGTPYAEVTPRQLLLMTSGVRFGEEYLDPASDVRRMARHLGAGGGMDDFALSLSVRDRAPGATFAYNSIDTHVLGLVLRGATGKDIPELMAEYLIAPLALEANPAYVTDACGTAFVLGGMLLRTRDYARFGQMILQGGAWQGRQVVPEAWVAEATVASAPTAPGEMGYGYQWWMPADGGPGEFLACGIYGQYIYFDRPRQVLVVATSANRRFSEEGVFDQALESFRWIARVA